MTDTNGSQLAAAKAAPAAAAATAVHPVWLVANSPWRRPTWDGSAPSVSSDCMAGSAAAKLIASVAPRTTSTGTLGMKG